MGTERGGYEYRDQHNKLRQEQQQNVYTPAVVSGPWAAEVADKLIALINSKAQSPTKDEIVRLIVGEPGFNA